MKIVHTSDWHLGHRFQEQSQYEEQVEFLKWLDDYIKSNQIDVLLIAGDVFDTGVPSSQSQKLYYDFLVKLQNSSCKHIVITGGNHDAPGILNAPKALLNALSIHVIGKATDNIEDEVLSLSVGSENVIIAGVPYLRDRDIRKAVAGESFDQLDDRYKTALINHYQSVADNCKDIDTTAPIIAMGHLFAVGGTTSDSEQSIYIGNLGDIGADDFPEIFDYIALGHLHRPQIIAKSEKIRYSGSPYILSFSEINYSKKIVVIETDSSNIKKVEEIEIPRFRQIYKVSGNAEDRISKLREIDSKKEKLTPWVEVVLDVGENRALSHREIKKVAEDLDLDVLKITLDNMTTVSDIKELMKSSKHVKELSPVDVFKLKCKDEHFELKQDSEIMDAFNEVLQIVRDHASME